MDTIATAKALGLIVPGVAYTLADLEELVYEATAPVDPDEDGERAFLRWAEGGWHANIRYEDPRELGLGIF